jgi:hypothetical protein
VAPDDAIPIARNPRTGKDRAEGFPRLPPPDPGAAWKDFRQLLIGLLWIPALIVVVLLAAGKSGWLATVALLALVALFYVVFYGGMVALGLGGLYLLIRFVKWAWQR